MREISCMGGFCHLRERCRYYWAGREGLKPYERLCRPGEDGASDVVPIRILWPVGSWERAVARRVAQLEPAT